MTLRPLFLTVPASLLLVACTVQLPANAGNDGQACQHSAPRALQLDLAGATELALELGPDSLVLTGAPGSSEGRIEGRICAPRADLLDSVQLVQRREGDRLLVRAERSARSGLTIGVVQSAWLDLRGSVPDSLPVSLRLGSGDFNGSQLAALKASVGSGDVDASDIAGGFSLRMGSGDVNLQRIGSLDIDSLGSGDVEADTIRGDARIGNIGSGDVSLKRIDGNVSVGNIGSGDLELEVVGGNIQIGAIGSGDVRARQVEGGLSVRHIGSGQIRHDQVRGALELPRGH